MDFSQLIHKLTWIQTFHAGFPVSKRGLPILFSSRAADIVGLYIYKMVSGHQAISTL